jgi:hypothetical protein
VVASATISNRTCWKQIHSTKERSFTELRFASSLAQLWVTWGVMQLANELRNGRHVGLDFYDLLIEAHNMSGVFRETLHKSAILMLIG